VSSYEELIKHIKRLRKRRGFTQQEVAFCLGISRQAYSRIENFQRDLKVEEYLRIEDMFKGGLNTYKPSWGKDEKMS
jgi:transcriptional regulator with XRE-family HTH domain